ncbi:MAG TPA: alpha/beta fold hydrolase [Pseudonocardiaceae bacterium]|jgi:pimeloyl-ACP methyl ester carboxylesterase
MAFDQTWPHRAERVVLPSEHGPLAALSAVPRGALATVVMVPGYTGSKEDFAPLLDAVADAGLAALAIDLPGQYESPGPPDEACYLPVPLGAVLAGVVRRLDPQPVILVGHSYGGLVCRAAVLAGATVAGLALLCSGPAALPAGVRRILLDHAEPILRTGGVAAVQELREAADASAGLAPRTPELAALLRRRFLDSTLAGLLGMAAGLRTEPDRVAELAAGLRSSGTPCLVACGDSDDAWPPEQQRDMAARLDAPFATIPAAAHSPNIENPAALLDLLLATCHAWLDGR